MFKLVAIFSVFLLMFAVSGVQKLIAPTIQIPAGLTEQSQVKSLKISPETDCCMASKYDASIAHGSCAIPCITLTNTEFADLAKSQLKFSPMRGAVFVEGVASLIKRPPKISLT